jgi:hypothetical protein
MQNNNFLNQYNNNQNNNNGNRYNNNNLLQNNPNFQNNNNLQQAQYIEHMKQLQKQKMMEHMENKIKEYTKNLLEPSKIKEDNSKIEQELKQKEKEFKQEHKINNLPYKQIMSDPKYGGKDYKKKHKKATFEKDVCVHKVTDKDKLGVEEDFTKIKNKVVEHDKTLKKIYSDNKETEHLKKFEYRKNDIYRVKYSGTDSVDLKKDKLKTFEKQQKEWEKEKIKTKNIIDECKEIGILNEEQMNDIMAELNN